MLYFFNFLLIPAISSGALLPSDDLDIHEHGIVVESGVLLEPVFFSGKGWKIDTPDSSVTRFVSRTTPLDNPLYKPDGLAPIASENINEAGRTSYLRGDARDALEEMAKSFRAHFSTPLVVVSGYRSAEYQKRLWDLGRCSDTLCAPPGHSEHQLGLAVDLFDASTKAEYLSNPTYVSYVDWLEENAYKYGYHMSYQNGVTIDEYQPEPWHWRYLGVELATRLHNLGWSLTEWARFEDMMKRNRE